MDQQIVGIFFLIRWNRGLARHAVSTRGHQQANQFLGGPMSLCSKPGCEPVQKLRMRWRLAKLSKIIRRRNNATAEQMKPNAVDYDAGEERIGRISHAAGQF